jgi:hypothetical protein
MAWPRSGIRSSVRLPVKSTGQRMPGNPCRKSGRLRLPVAAAGVIFGDHGLPIESVGERPEGDLLGQAALAAGYLAAQVFRLTRPCRNRRSRADAVGRRQRGQQGGHSPAAGANQQGAWLAQVRCQRQGIAPGLRPPVRRPA